MMNRVRPDNPCPVCGKPNWCLIAPDKSAAICQRVESPKRCGGAGWLHRLRDEPWRPARRFVRSTPISPTISRRPDFAALAFEYQRAVNHKQLHRLAAALGLSVASLVSLEIGWSTQHRAWSFPMVDTQGAVLGIRLRKPDGFKFCVNGSKDGLFIPRHSESDISPLLIAEGATDVAAIWDMGFRHVVGRPSCTGGVKLLVGLVRDRHPQVGVVVADGNEAGRRGAGNLGSVLSVLRACCLCDSTT